VLGAFAGYVVVRLLAGSGPHLFIEYRLDQPVGYINGEAGLLLMGAWAVLAAAERDHRAVVRAGAMGVAVLFVDLMVLTQSRAVIPALIGSVALLLAALPGRIRRACMLLCVGAGAAVALPWLLDVYAGHDASHPEALPSVGVTRAAGLAGVVGALLAATAWTAATSPRAVAWARGSRRAITVALVAVAAGLAGAGVVAVGDPIHELRTRWDTFHSLKVDRTASQRFTDAGGHRYDLWRIAVRELRDHPLRGVGAGNYVTDYYRLRKTPDFVRQPHSLELQVLAELGLPGALALAVFVGAVLTAALRRRSSLDLRLRIAAGGMFVVWLVHTSVDWLYNLPGLTGLALLAAAVLLARPVRAESSPRWEVPGRLAVTGALVALALLATSLGRHYAATLYQHKARAAVTRDPGAALGDARHALALDPYDPETYYVAAAAHARLDRYEQARGDLLEAAAREPFNYVPWALLGDLAARHGDDTEARRNYARAKALDPFDPLIVPTPVSR
jgi:hypothetical protein